VTPPRDEGTLLAVVTGASSGIGRALALEMGARGCDLLVCGRDAERLAGTAAAVREASMSRVEEHVCDLSVPSALKGTMDILARREPDILLNCAGEGVFGEFLATRLEDEERLLRVHLDALLGLTKAVLPGMVARGSGRILVVASVYAFFSVPGQAVYGAAKAAQLAFADALGPEVRKHGISVTTLCPGVVRTRFRERAGIREKGIRGADPGDVARRAVDALFRGRSLVLSDGRSRLHALAARWLPRRVMARLARRHNEKTRGLEVPAS